jgi:hypothetical protein
VTFDQSAVRSLYRDVQDCQLYAMSEKAYLTYFRKEMTHRAKEESKARKSKSSARRVKV